MSSHLYPEEEPRQFITAKAYRRPEADLDASSIVYKLLKIDKVFLNGIHEDLSKNLLNILKMNLEIFMNLPQ